MTRRESFKRRIRARMETTGERYLAARRMLLDQAVVRGGRTWLADPETSDAAVDGKTGRRWDAWCDLIDAWPGRDDGHTAIATWLRENHGLDGWWAQAVTVGYERITGRRLPHQMADGTFTAGRSRTVMADATELRAMLLDSEALFPGHDTALVSRPDARTLRIALGPGVASLSLEEKLGGRVIVTVAHRRLPELALVEEWKFYWAEWLDAIDAIEPIDDSADGTVR